jgi:amidase
MYAAQIVGTIAAFERLTGRAIGPNDVDPFNWALAELGRGLTIAQYLESEHWIATFTRRLASWWSDGFDLLLTPTLPEPPPRLGHFTPDPVDPTSTGLRASGFACWTSPFNMSGQPAISLPLHWTPDALPVGVQLVAPYAREDVLIRIAAQLEQAAPWKDRVPPIHA